LHRFLNEFVDVLLLCSSRVVMALCKRRLMESRHNQIGGSDQTLSWCSR
jgi:hypothetical protein